MPILPPVSRGGLLNAFRNHAAYLGAAPDAVQKRIDEITEQMEAIYVLG